jgi:hypothetical protein
LRCTDEPVKRPDMTAVVMELKECLDLETSNNEMSNMTSAIKRESTDHPTVDNLSVGEVHDSDIDILKLIGGMSVTDSGPSAT